MNTMNTNFAGYGLDQIGEIKLQNYYFHDTFEYFILNFDKITDLNKSDIERLKMIQDFLSMFESSINKGFLTNCDLSCYPVYAEILPLFLKEADVEFISGVRSGESFEVVV